jgi:signal transduction histidine kinase
MTFPLLFEGVSDRELSVDILLIERVCRRLPQAVRILTNRQRKGKASFAITDEYDVQDVLHGVLRAYLKYSVQEDPIPKSAGTKSARADISIQDLGLLIDVKYARGPDDQRRIFEEFSQDWSCILNGHISTCCF